ncbi:hypothetical protein D3C87_2010160 [compost metagenome]
MQDNGLCIQRFLPTLCPGQILQGNIQPFKAPGFLNQRLHAQQLKQPEILALYAESV